MRAVCDEAAHKIKTQDNGQLSSETVSSPRPSFLDYCYPSVWFVHRHANTRQNHDAFENFTPAIRGHHSSTSSLPSSATELLFSCVRLRDEFVDYLFQELILQLLQPCTILPRLRSLQGSKMAHGTCPLTAKATRTWAFSTVYSVTMTSGIYSILCVSLVTIDILRDKKAAELNFSSFEILFVFYVYCWIRFALHTAYCIK